MDITTKRDVLVVGAGAAGLTAALHLSNQNLKVTVIDGAVHPGAENWSGCVFFGENLADPEVLGDDWLDETAIERKLVARGIYMTNGIDAGGISYRDPETFKNCATVLRPVFDHDLSEIARHKGIEVLSRTTALGLLREDGKTIGVATEKGPIYSDLVFLAEGDAAHLVSKEGYSNLKPGDKGHYLQGIKEVIHLKPEIIDQRFKVKPGEGAAYEMLIRNARIGGKTIQLNMGAFIYTNRESLSIGLVLPLDNLAKHFKGDHNKLMEWFKSLPIVKSWIQGGTRTAYGAKIINANGYKNLAQLCDNGLAIGGACTGIGLDFPYPNYTGPASFTGLCLGRAVKAIKHEGLDFSRENLDKHYAASIRKSQYYKDMQVTQNWGDYIASTKSFFSLFCDVKLDCSHPFLEGKGFFSAFRSSCRSFFYHTGNGKLTVMIKDLIKQKKAAGAVSVGPLGVIGAWFSASPLRLAPEKQGDIRIEFFHGEQDVTAKMHPALKLWTSITNPTLKAAFNVLYRNQGEDLEKKFKTLNHVIAKRGFLPLALMILMSPLFIMLALINGIIDIFADKKKIMQSSTAKRIMAARKIQELSSFTPESSVEDKLSDIVYETEKSCHIKVHWPRDTYLPESDPNSALWHICPAGVYHAEKDPAGMLRPVVDYENCVKCESCWRGSPLADWGRRGSHRLIYRVKTSALTTLIRHQAKHRQAFKSGKFSEFNMPLEASDKQLTILAKIDATADRVHELIVSNNRTFNASERKWILNLVEELAEAVSCLSTDFPDKRIKLLVETLKDSVENIKGFIDIERFFWADAELLVMKQHALRQLGLKHIPVEVLMPKTQVNPAATAAAHFTLTHLHHIKKHGLGNDDLSMIKDWLCQSTTDNELTIIKSLAKVDLSLTALYLNCRLAQKITSSSKFISLIVCEDAQIRGDLITAHIPFALSAIANEYLLVTRNGAWIVDPSAQGFSSEKVGTIGLRLAVPMDVKLKSVSGVKVKNYQGLNQLLEDGHELFYTAVVGAGEYLLDKSINHAGGRIQFPDLFQDEHGRDGIIKFGAVKALIAHMAWRLELLKAAQNSSFPAVYKYVQAGKWLGTQEGSFTYNATQVFGGTGFSEDDTLSPYYRDASIFKFLLGDPFKVQLQHDAKSDDQEKAFTYSSLLHKPAEWLNKGLAADKTIQAHHQALLFRAEADYNFITAILEQFNQKEKNGAKLLYLQQIIELAAKVYWQSARARAHDSKMYDSRSQIGARLHKEDWKKLQAQGRHFSYDKFLAQVTSTATGTFLVTPDFRQPRYSPENSSADSSLATKAEELNNHFKSYFIDKDFDGMSYCRYAEKMHGHSNEVIKMFHDKGYMRLIIPKELGGEGCHKSIYYLLISASMQYGDPALSLIIQASTSIGTSPMLLAWKKDIPKAVKDVEQLAAEKEKFTSWIEACNKLVKTLETPDPQKIKKLFQKMADEVKELAGKNSVFKSQCSSFLYGLHKAGQAGMSFQLDVMAQELQKASGQLEAFVPTIDAMTAKFKARQAGVGFFLSLIASGQTSAFALTEPSAGSDTARVATRASLKEVELTRRKNGAYAFNNDEGEERILIDLQQTRFHEGKLQVRLKEEDDWSVVHYDKYSWDDDSGYRYILVEDQEFIFHEFGRVSDNNGQLLYRYYELTGSKMWITNGRFAGLFALYAKTAEGITGLCVDRYAEGLTVGKDEDKMGQNASPTNEIFLDKVRVCTSFVLGLEGRGQVNALETLNVGRAGLSLSSLALTEDLIEATVNYSDGKESDNVLVGQMMEEMSGAFPASYEMIGIFDSPESDARMESAIGKFMNSEILHRAILYSEGVHSANSQTFNFDVEKKKRDARILNIYEGTNEIQRFLILKDLIEQIAKKDYTPPIGDPLPELQQWDEYRCQLLDLLKTVKRDLGSKAWMDSQLQPVFFYLAEIAGWLKFTDGAIWRKLDLKNEQKHVIYAAVESAIKRGLFEVDKYLNLFNAAYEQLAKGIRPPEVAITGLLLQELEHKADRCLLPADHGTSHLKIQSFLAVKPLNKPHTEILDGQNIDDTSVLVGGSQKIFERLLALPQSCQVEILCAAPDSAEPLMQHLSSAGNVTWVRTGDKWPGASVCSSIWRRHIKKDCTLIFDGSSPAWLGAANLVAHSGDKEIKMAQEFALQANNVLVLHDSKTTRVNGDSALVLTSSFKGPTAKSKRTPGRISIEKIAEFKTLEALLPAKPPKAEDARIDSPEAVAGYLSKKLGIEQSDKHFKITECSGALATGVCLVGSLKGGEISRDTISSLDNLLVTYPDMTLIIPGAKEVQAEVLNKCNNLPSKTLLLDYPEAWLADTALSASCISELSTSFTESIFFVPSRAAEAGRIAAEANISFATGITKVKKRDSTCHVWSEQSEGSVIIQSEIEGRFIGIMSPSPEPGKGTSDNIEGTFKRIPVNDSTKFDLIKESLDSSRQELELESISDAEFILDIGYGIGNQDNYDEFIQPLVDTMQELGIKVTIGASRKLVETLKILPPETQIGQSGSSVTPKILIAVGISGAPQHINYIGMSTIIISFNIDPQAPLMVLNDSKPFPKVYPIAGNLKKTLPALQKALQSLLLAGSPA